MNQEKVLTVSQIVSVEKVVYHFFKRLFDIIVGLIGIIMLIPLTIIIKIVSLINKDTNSVFYKQKRIGKNGKEFTIYKYRTMVENADNILENLMISDEELKKEYTLNKKLKNDPRITKVGKFLRKTSIDEVPQVINIFLGDMSLIGNRPYLPKEKKDMTEYYDDIVKTKPGLTGYWQVSGRSNLTFENRLKLESYYSNNNSLKLDAKIFLKTFAIVFKCTGAK